MNNSRPSSGKPDPKTDKDRGEQSRRRLGFGISYVITSLLFLWLYPLLFFSSSRTSEIPYSQFMKALADGQVESVMIGERSIVGQMKAPKADGLPSNVSFITVRADGSPCSQVFRKQEGTPGRC